MALCGHYVRMHALVDTHHTAAFTHSKQTSHRLSSEGKYPLTMRKYILLDTKIITIKETVSYFDNSKQEKTIFKKKKNSNSQYSYVLNRLHFYSNQAKNLPFKDYCY